MCSRPCFTYDCICYRARFILIFEYWATCKTKSPETHSHAQDPLFVETDTDANGISSATSHAQDRPVWPTKIHTCTRSALLAHTKVHTWTRSAIVAPIGPPCTQVCTGSRLRRSARQCPIGYGIIRRPLDLCNATKAKNT